MVARAGAAAHEGLAREFADRWLDDYFELTEVHVRPASQGHGVGEELMRCLLGGLERQGAAVDAGGPDPRVAAVLQAGLTDVLRHYHFTGDPRPFAVLGRELPL